MSYISISKNRAKNNKFDKKNRFIRVISFLQFQHFKPILLML